FNNKFKLIPNKDLKTDYNRTILNVKEVININENDKITNFEHKIFEQYQFYFIPTIPKNAEKTNNFSDISNTSKTFLPSKNYDTNSTYNNKNNPANCNEINSANDYENNSPYDNDFDLTNFPRDFLNFFITELNENYLEKCENIFSVVAEKISELQISKKSENRVSDSTNYKKIKKYYCYLKINIFLRFILKEIFPEDLPIFICTNEFINLNDSDLDLIKNKNAEYNIFRTNEEENMLFISLINKIEQKYGNEANKMAKSAYNNFLEKSNLDIFVVMEKICSGQNDKKNILYQKINLIFYAINDLINFTNDQITETESLIIYKVLKSISKNLKKTSNDLFISRVFPEFRIINILYHSRMNVHQILERKFYTGIFLKKILKQKLKNFKDRYQSFEKIDNLDDDYLKDILEIRVFYIFNFFKFINIKKPYLMAYILLSI
ncbi:hypothetical protein DMUE_5838, partial [Dictyocoela muelleri]